MELDAPNGKPKAARPNRNWVWFFVVLVVLAVLAIGVELWFNLRQQLHRPDLEAARMLWNQKGPRDYDLEYTKRGSASGTFVVRVRGGRVASATMDGQPMEPRLYPYADMGGLFDDVERFLEMDSAPGSPRSFTKAQFDPVDGHLMYYVRSVMASRQRIEIVVRLQMSQALPQSASPDLPRFNPK